MTDRRRKVARAGRTTLSDSVAAEIEQQILEGDMQPGERLPTELELGEELDVSRSVVRDAIRTLSARGLVTVQQGMGMVVASPNDEAFSDAMVALLMRSDLTMGDVTEARAVIETECAVLAAQNGTPADFDGLKASLDAFAAAVAAGDVEAVREHHFAFHRGILEAVHLPALELLLRPVQRVVLITALPAEGGDASDWEFETHPPILAARGAAHAPPHGRDQGHGGALLPGGLGRVRRVPPDAVPAGLHAGGVGGAARHRHAGDACADAAQALRRRLAAARARGVARAAHPLAVARRRRLRRRRLQRRRVRRAAARGPAGIRWGRCRDGLYIAPTS
jgi:GntR family transcriptional repressor for pyruvate dehydrogenase complex